MKFILIFIIFFTFALIESSFIAVPLLLLFILSWSVHAPWKYRFWASFAAGLFVDIFTARPFGATSIFFLITALIVSRYQKKIETRNFLYLVIFSLITIIFYQFVFFRSLNVAIIAVAIIFSIPLSIFTYIISDRMFEKSEIELEV